MTDNNSKLGILEDMKQAEERTRIFYEEERRRDANRPMYCCVELSRAISYDVILINEEKRIVTFNIKDEVKSRGTFPIRICPYCGVKLQTVINYSESDLKNGFYNMSEPNQNIKRME